MESCEPDTEDKSVSTLLNAEYGMLVRVFAEPEIDLLLKVSVLEPVIKPVLLVH